MSVDEIDLYHPGELFVLEYERQGQLPKCKPIKIKILATMNGIVFAIKCRACPYGNFAYVADLELAFESADRHIARHKYQMEVVDKGLANAT